MSRTRDLIEALKDGAGDAAKAIGGQMLEAMKEGAAAVGKGAENLMDGVANVVYSEEMKYQAGRGAQEMASALFNGSAFVQYGHGAQNDQEKAKDGKEGAEQEQQKEQERGGRDM